MHKAAVLLLLAREEKMLDGADSSGLPQDEEHSSQKSDQQTK